jgi:hypothetical protein
MINKILLVLLSASVTLSMCKNAKEKTSSTSTAPITTPAAAPKPAAAVTGTTPISLEAYPKASASKTAYLTTGPWKMGGAISPSDDNIMSTFPADLITFASDGSVKFEKATKSVGAGKWTYDDKMELLVISSNIPKLNSSWKTMEAGFRLVWLGNTDLNKSGDQLMWNCVK